MVLSFDTIRHANLMATVAERICDGEILRLIQMWLKAPVMEMDKDGTKRNIGGGKGNRHTAGRGHLTAVGQSLPAHTGQDMGTEQPATTAGSPHR